MTKVLLIEDNLEVLDNTSELLELANYDVVTAENGKVGVKKAKETLPDIIVCDVMMPVLDGYEVLYLLSKDPKTAQIPFIFLTAKAEKTDFRKGMGLGADDYLTKPFEEMDLLNSIESRLAKRDLLKKESESPNEKLNNFLWKVESVTDLKDLTKNQKKRSYKKKNAVYYNGDKPAHLYFINSGKVKTFKVNEDSKEYVTGVYKEGDFFGFTSLLTDSDYDDNAEALQETELTLVPSTDFQSLIFNNRDVSSQFVKMLACDIQEKEDQLIHLAYDTVRKRVAHSLLALEEKYKEGSEESPLIKVSRDDLASMVGTATESVIRMISEFKEEGLISVSGSKIIVLKHNELREINY